MQSNRTSYGWMALGGLLCLLGLGLACKMREGNMVRAESEPKLPAGPHNLDKTPLVPLPLDGNELPTGPNADRAPTLNVPPLPVPVNMARTAPVAPALPSVEVPPVPALPLMSGPTAPVVPVGFQQVMPTTVASPLPVPPLPEPRGSVDFTAPQSVGPPPLTPRKEVDRMVIPVPTQPEARVGRVSYPVSPSDVPPLLTEKPGDTVPAAPYSPPAAVTTPAVVAVRAETRPMEQGEPPLAPAPGPVQMYQVRLAQESLRDIARRTLGDSDRWPEIYKLNPSLKPEAAVLNGTYVRLPADACLPPEDVSEVKPLPILRPDVGPARPKVLLPLTGTYPCNLDEKRVITLPRAMRDQIADGETVLVSPGPDHCLWVTTQDHLERLSKRLDASAAREHEVRGFRRLYFAQTEKLTLSSEGRIQLPERLTQFAGLHQEVVLIGIDDHFELWDVARWRAYTQTKSAAARSAMSED